MATVLRATRLAGPLKLSSRSFCPRSGSVSVCHRGIVHVSACQRGVARMEQQQQRRQQQQLPWQPAIGRRRETGGWTWA
ncbi:unnamed protein product, partial [Closterium sp. NIES-53]